MINLDLLIKLVRLANNNPNENEANLAARKVCKMIAENNYKFIEEQPKTAQSKVNTQSTPRQQSHPWSWNWTQAQQDFMNREAARREEERKRWYDESANLTEEELRFAQERERARKQREEENKKFWENFGGRYWGIPNQKKPPDNPFRPDFNQPPPKKEKKPMICTKCKQQKMTSYLGPEFLFVCQDCVWQTFEKERTR